MTTLWILIAIMAVFSGVFTLIFIAGCDRIIDEDDEISL